MKIRWQESGENSGGKFLRRLVVSRRSCSFLINCGRKTSPDFSDLTPGGNYREIRGNCLISVHHFWEAPKKSAFSADVRAA